MTIKEMKVHWRIFHRKSRKFFATSFIRFRTTEHTFMVLVAILIGLVGGFGAVGIQFLIKLIQQLMWGTTTFTPEVLRSVSLYVKILAPAVGGIFVGAIVYYISKEAKGHGVPEVMEAMVLRNGVIRLRVVFAKLIASSICIGSGGSVGREGPVIQIGSAVGSGFGQLLRVNPQRMKVFVACGAAAGIAAAFNAPIAGALFSVEIILGDFALAQFSPIVISSVMATVVSHAFLGDFPAFVVPSYQLISSYELIFYAVLGVLMGFIAVLFIKTLYSLEDFFDGWKIHGLLKPAIGGLLLGIIGIFVPNIFGVGYESMNIALNGQMLWYTMLLLIFAKIIATSLSLGSGGSGGIFAPSLFIGTMAGGFFGAILQQFFPNTGGPGAYALVGMGAMVAGATQGPITAILIIFEMTNDYKIILPLMISTVIATILATKLKRGSIYTLKLLQRGIDISGGKEVNVLRSLEVQDVMAPDPVVIPANLSFHKLLELVVSSPQHQFFVLDMEKRYIGSISINEVRQTLLDEEFIADLVIAHDLVNPDVPTVKPNANLEEVMMLLGQCEVEELPVAAAENPEHIIGIITYRDVIEAYNHALRKRELAHEMVGSVNLFEQGPRTSFLGNSVVGEIPVPASFVGKTLRELNIRARYQVNILMIRRLDRDHIPFQVIPQPQEKLVAGDVLIAMGAEKDLSTLRKV